MPSSPSPSRPRTARERARAAVLDELLTAARRHLATDGPGQLSLRAIARDLGVASSAVYRYVESRDALLTLLLVEAYDAVGETTEAALDAALARGDEPGRAWLEVARAFRAWALADPHQYALVYGSPVPGYAAPQDTVGPAVRLWGVVARVVVAARASGALQPAQPVVATGLVEPEVLAFAAGIAAGVTTPDAYAGAQAGRPADAPRALPAGVPAGGLAVDPATLEADVTRSITLFAALVGGVSAELFGHLHRLATDPARVFDLTTATAARGVGLAVPLDDPA